MVLLLLLWLFFNIIKGYQKQLHPVSTHAEDTIKWPYKRNFSQENNKFFLFWILWFCESGVQTSSMATCFSGVQVSMKQGIHCRNVEEVLSLFWILIAVVCVSVAAWKISWDPWGVTGISTDMIYRPSLSRVSGKQWGELFQSNQHISFALKKILFTAAV